jgi:hypothetical protein
MNRFDDLSHDDSDLTAAAETVEAEFMPAYPTGTPALLGIATRRLAGGVVISMPADPVLEPSRI